MANCKTLPNWLRFPCCFSLAWLASCGSSLEEPAAPQVESNAVQGELFAYVGTYSTEGSDGIYIFRFDPDSGALHLSGTARDPHNPSFLALDPSGSFLYAVNEIPDFEGRPAGAVAAYRIDPASGGLTFLNRKPSGGGGPCHLNVDRTGRYVLVANYGGGSVSTLPVNADGSLGDPAAFVQHEGSSIDPERQQGPHAHSIDLSPDNRRAYVCDLGLDQVLIYAFDAAGGLLQKNAPRAFSTQPGAGPRHLAFHPTGKFVYVINEMNSTVVALTHDPVSGALSPIQTVSTVPPDFSEANYTAEIEVHPSGRFLYGSNRGHNSIAVFRIEPQAGSVELVELEPTRGDFPRNFAVDPSGRFLVAANQRTNNLEVFKIDQETGELEHAGFSLSVPSPVCVKFRRTGSGG